MSKKYKPLGAQLSDYVRGDLSIIDQKNKLLEAYEADVVKKVFEEAQTNNLKDALIYLAEKYHPDLGFTRKQGRVLKWTPELQVMLAVWFEMRPAGLTIDQEIEDMLTKPYWRNLVNAGNQKQVDGAESLKAHRKKGRKSADFELEMMSYQADPEKWIKKLANKLKIYGDKTIS